jgi:CBS domain-containing protein
MTTSEEGNMRETGPSAGHDERSVRMTVRPDEVPRDQPTIGEIATEPPITCPPITTVHGAAALMAETRIGALVIESESPMVITERDVLFAVVDRAIDEPVTNYATKDPVTIATTASLGEAARIMAESGVRHLLVTDDRHVVGVFTSRDLIANQVITTESRGTD